jgi:TonB family protein
VTAQTPSKDSAKTSGSRPSTAEAIEEAPDEDSPRSVGFKPPEFLNRVKPEYTSEAELADITATVEAMVVFRSSGEVGEIDITRWAGFGLDDSAKRAIRQLKFKPATREGKSISARALIRYNFRRVTEPAQKPEPPAPKPPDKPERDLRKLFKPTYRRP